MASESSHYQVLVAIYAPIYISLIDVLLQKSQYPPDDGYDSWGEGLFIIMFHLDIVCFLLIPLVMSQGKPQLIPNGNGYFFNHCAASTSL